MGALLSPTSDNFVQKTLGAQLLAGATTVTLNNTTSIPNLPGAFIVDRINTNDVETPNAREVITYTGVSGSTLTGLTRNADGSGSDQDHAINAIVEFGPDILWAQSVYDALTKVVVASTGLLDTTKVVDLTTAQTLTNKTLTAPKLADGGFIADANGNEGIKLVTTPSAENEVTVTPAATGNAPSLAATGGDTNIDLRLTPKGSGALTVPSGTYEANVTDDDDIPNKKYVDDRGATDGWTASSDTWTYASATSFTIAGSDRTTTYTKGTRIKLTQTSAKYFVVTSSSFSTDTTVNITGGTDYTLANAAITSPYYSYQANPQGYPDRFAYTPTYTGFSANPTTSAAFRVIGKLCFYELHGSANGTSNTTGKTVTLPIAAGATITQVSFMEAVVDNGTQSIGKHLIVPSATTSTIYPGIATANWTASGACNVASDGAMLIYGI